MGIPMAFSISASANVATLRGDQFVWFPWPPAGLVSQASVIATTTLFDLRQQVRRPQKVAHSSPEAANAWRADTHSGGTPMYDRLW